VPTAGSRRAHAYALGVRPRDHVRSPSFRQPTAAVVTYPPVERESTRSARDQSVDRRRDII